MTPAQRTTLLNQVIVSLRQGTTNILPSHLDRYDQLRSRLPVVDVGADKSFQRTFSGLFRLRFMPTAHRAAYFGMMETHKGQVAISFPAVLAAYQAVTSRWEVSFVSKLIHIVEPSQAVWDSIVSSKLGYVIPPTRSLTSCTVAYQSLETEMAALLADPLFSGVQAAFSARFPGRAYTPMRILDASIWGLG